MPSFLNLSSVTFCSIWFLKSFDFVMFLHKSVGLYARFLVEGIVEFEGGTDKRKYLPPFWKDVLALLCCEFDTCLLTLSYILEFWLVIESVSFLKLVNWDEGTGKTGTGNTFLTPVLSLTKCPCDVWLVLPLNRFPIRGFGIWFWNTGLCCALWKFKPCFCSSEDGATWVINCCWIENSGWDTIGCVIFCFVWDTDDWTFCFVSDADDLTWTGFACCTLIILPSCITIISLPGTCITGFVWPDTFSCIGRLFFIVWFDTPCRRSGVIVEATIWLDVFCWDWKFPIWFVLAGICSAFNWPGWTFLVWFPWASIVTVCRGVGNNCPGCKMGVSIVGKFPAITCPGCNAWLNICPAMALLFWICPGKIFILTTCPVFKAWLWGYWVSNIWLFSPPSWTGLTWFGKGLMFWAGRDCTPLLRIWPVLTLVIGIAVWLDGTGLFELIVTGLFTSGNWNEPSADAFNTIFWTVPLTNSGNTSWPGTFVVEDVALTVHCCIWGAATIGEIVVEGLLWNWTKLPCVGLLWELINVVAPILLVLDKDESLDFENTMVCGNSVGVGCWFNLFTLSGSKDAVDTVVPCTLTALPWTGWANTFEVWEWLETAGRGTDEDVFGCGVSLQILKPRGLLFPGFTGSSWSVGLLGNVCPPTRGTKYCLPSGCVTRCPWISFFWLTFVATFPVKMFVLLVFLVMFSSAVNDRFKEPDGARLDDIGLSTEPIVDWLTEPLDILVGISVGGLMVGSSVGGLMAGSSVGGLALSVINIGLNTDPIVDWLTEPLVKLAGSLVGSLTLFNIGFPFSASFDVCLLFDKLPHGCPVFSCVFPVSFLSPVFPFLSISTEVLGRI